jgi:cation:H+ antiporter
MPDFANWPLWANALIFLASACVVWIAGSRLASYVDAIAGRTGMGQGFAGLVLLGGITSLPEVAVSVTSAVSGESVMAVSTLLGAVAVQVTVLAVADVIIGRDALTSVVASPVVLLQGTFGILMLALIAMAITVGDIAVGPVGLWSLLLVAAYLGGIWLLANYEQTTPGWTARRTPGQEAGHEGEEVDERPLSRLALLTAAAAGCILVAGWALSLSGGAMAEQTGLGAAFFGATLLAVATSLPEISTVVASVRMKRYEMALGDIFGTNLFNATLIFIIDLASSGPPVLARVGAFSVAGALLGLVLTGIFLAGIIERRDRTVLRMGWDSLAALACYAVGVALLFTLRDATGG